MAGMSSKPTRLTSCGTRTPCSCSARATPTAWLSLAQTMHVGRLPPVRPMLSRMWFILPYASEDSQVSHCTVTELTALAAHSLFHASRRVAASRHSLGPAKYSTERCPYSTTRCITSAIADHWSMPTTDTRRRSADFISRRPSCTPMPPCVDVTITRGCAIRVRHAAENMTSVGVRKMNASTFISSKVRHRSSNSSCEHSASCTMLTVTNRPCWRAIVSIAEIVEIGP